VILAAVRVHALCTWACTALAEAVRHGPSPWEHWSAAPLADMARLGGRRLAFDAGARRRRAGHRRGSCVLRWLQLACVPRRRLVGAVQCCAGCAIVCARMIRMVSSVLATMTHYTLLPSGVLVSEDHSLGPRAFLMLSSIDRFTAYVAPSICLRTPAFSSRPGLVSEHAREVQTKVVHKPCA
jgi:hypothetical protein